MRRIVLPAAAVALAVLLWIALRDEDDVGPAGDPRPPVDTERAVLTGRSSQPGPKQKERETSSQAPAESPISEDVPPPFRIRAVTEDGGAAIEGVSIVLAHADGGPHRTGHDGEVAIVLPRAGLTAAHYQATKPGFLRTGSQAVRGELNVVRMQPGARVTGRVLAAADGAPVEGAVVRTWRTASRTETCDASTTDVLGQFALDGVALREQVLIVAHASGLHPVASPHTFTQDEDGLILQVGGGGTLEGVVRRDDGSPVAGLAVWLVRPGMPLLPRREGRMWLMGGSHEALLRFYYPAVETDDGGRFTFRGIPLGEDRLPVARLSELADVPADPVRFERDGETLIRDIDLPTVASITVRVLDAEGHVLPDVQVDFTSPRIWFDLRQVGRPNDDGSRTVEGLTPGAWTLRAWTPSSERLEQEVVLAAGEDRTFVLQAVSGLEIEGQVVDARGRPVAHAEVTFEGPPHRRATADVSGQFRITGLTDVEGTLEVEPGFLTRIQGETRERPLAMARREAVWPGGEALRIVLPDGGWLAGRIAGVEPGTELLRGFFSRDVTGGGDCLVAEDGGFRHAAPRPGIPFVVRFDHADGRFALCRVAALEVGQDHDLGTLRLGHGASLEGHVLDPAGAGIENARIRLTQRWTKRDLRTGTAGSYRLDRLPEFPVEVRVDAPGLPPAYRLLDPRESGAHDIRLARGGLLELRVLDADAEPVTAGTISIVWDVSSPYDRDLDDLRDLYLLDPRGTTKLRREAGAYRLRVATEDADQWATAVAEVRDGETTTLEVRLAR